MACMFPEDYPEVSHQQANLRFRRKTKENDVEADAPILIIGGSDTSSITLRSETRSDNVVCVFC